MILNQFKEFLKSAKEHSKLNGRIYFDLKEDAVDQLINFLEEWEEKTLVAEITTTNKELSRYGKDFEDYVKTYLKRNFANEICKLDLPITKHESPFTENTKYRTSAVILTKNTKLYGR